MSSKKKKKQPRNLTEICPTLRPLHCQEVKEKRGIRMLSKKEPGDSQDDGKESGAD